ncbi:hypothetical protein EYZ11_012673 [Aspergillus tanneri]|uniref:Condensation domain-containing protein n=1 Tax=Aspergillus tanneri TaxID=1220188 RepID=A0A4S3IZM1_9EURO|nr:hypothetical protein EYZ11_012673 [Aspergillus tanneri]
MDGVSLEVILSDLQKVYQRQSLNLTFWKRKFPDIPPEFPILPLTTVTDRKTLLQYGHYRVQQRLDVSLGRQIRQVCKSAKSTPSHFYLAAFVALLCRLADPITSTGFNHDGSIFAYAASYDWNKGFRYNTPEDPMRVVFHPVDDAECRPKNPVKR